jgi:hypothetical protein
VRVWTECPNCICEAVSVGRHGSPGRVKSAEKLLSVLINPSDFDSDQIALSFITHAERRGMSVLRGAASNDEFRETLSLRLKKANQTFHGVAIIDCSEVRGLASREDKNGRVVGDRLYYVLDTDAACRPHHADIFATLPKNSSSRKAAWRAQRSYLMELVRKEIVAPADFRDGALSHQMTPASQQSA